MLFNKNCCHISSLEIPQQAIDFESQIVLNYRNGYIYCNHGNVDFVVDFLSKNSFFTKINLNWNNFLTEIDSLQKVSEQIKSLNLERCPLLNNDAFYSVLSQFKNLIELRIGAVNRKGANFNDLLNNLTKLSLLYLNNCQLNTQEIDEILNLFANSLETRFSQIGALYLQNNSPPSGNSTSAIDTLINAGWTIIHD